MIDLTFLANLSGTLEFPSSLPLGLEFGFNTNVLETNIINLTVVVGVVVTFGGNALRSLLGNRRQVILNSLQEADQRALEAKQKLGRARSQLEQAQLKAAEIKEQGNVAASGERERTTRETQSDIKRLEENKQKTLDLYRQKAVHHVQALVLSAAVDQLLKEYERISLWEPFHIAVNKLKLLRYTSYRRKADHKRRETSKR